MLSEARLTLLRASLMRGRGGGDVAWSVQAAVEVLTALAYHSEDGQNTIDSLIFHYVDDASERSHELLTRTKRALASLERRGLVRTWIARDEQAGRPRSWMGGPSGFCTRTRTFARITEEGRALAPKPPPLTREQQRKRKALVATLRR